MRTKFIENPNIAQGLVLSDYGAIIQFSVFESVKAVGIPFVISGVFLLRVSFFLGISKQSYPLLYGGPLRDIF